MELGFHMAHLTFTGGPAQLGATAARIAREAEAGGLTRLTVMDHFWQISAYGPPEKDMLEAYTLLGFIAGQTSKLLLHTLVAGVVYRDPAVLGKAVTTLDVLSGGRAALGIGAAWNEEESRGLGLLFPPRAERFERLEEAVQIILQMFSGSDAPYHGKHYHLERTLSVPAPLSRPRPYLMIGGVGERKTLRMVAQYADASNFVGTADIPHLLGVLRGHCDALGRDYDTIQKTVNTRIGPDTTRDEYLATLAGLRDAGISVVYTTSTDPEPLRSIELIASAVPEVSGW